MEFISLCFLLATLVFSFFVLKYMFKFMSFGHEKSTFQPREDPQLPDPQREVQSGARTRDRLLLIVMALAAFLSKASLAIYGATVVQYIFVALNCSFSLVTLILAYGMYVSRGRRMGNLSRSFGVYYYFTVNGINTWHHPTPLEILRFLCFFTAVGSSFVDLFIVAVGWSPPRFIKMFPTSFGSVLFLIGMMDYLTWTLAPHVSTPYQTHSDLPALPLFNVSLFNCSFISVCSILVAGATFGLSYLLLEAKSHGLQYVYGGCACICSLISLYMLLSGYATRGSSLGELHRRGIYQFFIEDGQEIWHTPSMMETARFFTGLASISATSFNYLTIVGRWRPIQAMLAFPAIAGLCSFLLVVISHALHKVFS